MPLVKPISCIITDMVSVGRKSTKSRSRHSNDNALAESKNGAIVRKYLGYTHIAQKWAPLINAFNREHLVPYLNFHRPCYFAEIKIDAKGKERKFYPYRSMMTPYEKLTNFLFNLYITLLILTSKFLTT